VNIDAVKLIKDHVRIVNFRPDCQSYPCLSQRLPCFYDGATPPRPDPGHLLSIAAGLCKRAAVKTPPLNRVLLRKLKRFVDLWLRRNLKPLQADEVPTFEEWLEGTTYDQKRKQSLSELWTDCGGNPTLKKLRKVKCFIKDETYPEYKYPRGIYSRSDYAKCMFGPLVAAISDKVFALPWFIKKIPVVDRPVAIYERLFQLGAEYHFTDYTSFESHFKAWIQKVLENRLFVYMSKNLPDLRKIVVIMHQIKSGLQHLTFKLIDVIMEAFRCSGEMDTSLSNGFSNLMLWLFASWEFYQLPEDKIDGFVEGDDGLFNNHGPSPTVDDFYRLGFTIKVGVTKVLSEASFCGQVYDIEDLSVVTDPREVVCRLGWTNKKYVRAGERVKLELLRSRAYSLVYQYTHCPILGVLGKKLLELTAGIVVRQSIIDQLDQWEKAKLLEYVNRVDMPDPNPGTNTRNLVEKLYSITVSEQLAIEKKIADMKVLGPLPFHFSETPEVWVDYFERFSAYSFADPPIWNRNNERKLYSQLIAAGLELPDFFSLRGVG
jgi:hypothetical protein